MGRLTRLTPWAALTPFLGYLLVFLVVPTITVIVGAFQDDGGFTLDNISALFTNAALTVLWRSVVLSAVSALVGACFGAFLAYLIVGRPATRRQYCQVLAPRFTAASRHWGRIPSRAGRKTITISGIWK